MPKQILVPLVNVVRNRVRFSPRASASSQRSGRNSNGLGKTSELWLRIHGFAPILVLGIISRKFYLKDEMWSFWLMTYTSWDEQLFVLDGPLRNTREIVGCGALVAQRLVDESSLFENVRNG